MRSRLSRRLGVLIAVILVAFLGVLPTSQAASGGTQLRPIGTPLWKPVDCHVFSAPVGTAETGYAEFVQTAERLLPPPNHVRQPDLTIAPGSAHQPPYDTELRAGVQSLGLHEGHAFVSSEFSDGSGVFLVCMAVPAPGATGSSPDFASGPIIPNTVFPLHVKGEATRNGIDFDPFLADFKVPPLTTAIDPRFDVDGHSHFPIFLATTQDFGPAGEDLTGRYVYDLTLTDAAGNGWSLQAHFVITR